ncbi:hypothetical protein P8452_20588 [Trifolium repens]|nr:hypothetical protein P8452_20588 [Trifolium repens]
MATRPSLPPRTRCIHKICLFIIAQFLLHRLGRSLQIFLLHRTVSSSPSWFVVMANVSSQSQCPPIISQGSTHQPTPNDAPPAPNNPSIDATHTPNDNMESQILRFIYVPAPHTSERLSAALVEYALMCARSWLWSAESTGNLNSKVGKANGTLLPEMESEDEGELAINGATSISDSGLI